LPLVAVHGEVAYAVQEPGAEPARPEIPGEPVPGSIDDQQPALARDH
jgi:hypothetical protein